MYVFTDSTLKYLLKKIKSKIALKSELDNKVDKVNGKGLSDKDFTDAAKQLLENKYSSVEASYSTGMTHIKFSNKDQSNTKTIDLKTGCDMFFYPTIDAELLSDLNGNVTIPYAFISKSGSDTGKVTVNIKNLANNTSSENVFNVTDNGSELVLEGVSSGNANLSFTIEGDTDGLKANVLGNYSTVIMLPLTVYRSTNSSLVPSNVSNPKTVVSDFGNGEYEIMLYAAPGTNHLNFSNVQTLTNVSYVSDDITNMRNTYTNCYNLTGTPICGNNVTTMYMTYYGCSNLTGSPVCGNNVTNMAYAYCHCPNLYGDMYVYSDSISNASYCFFNRNASKQLNVLVNFGTKSYDSFKAAYAFGSSLVLTRAGNGSIYYWNDTANIVIFNMQTTNMYNVFNGDTIITKAACGPNVTNMCSAYFDCNNLKGAPVCGPNVTDMSYTYYSCEGLTGSPVCGDNVTNMGSAYTACRSLTGSPVCGPNVTTMANTYLFCRSLTGSSVCGDKVTNMANTYEGCIKLTGSPVCGPNVINMSSAYRSCSSLTGSPVCGNKVTNMSFAYAYCDNLTGPPVCGPNVTRLWNAYSDCYNLSSNGYFFSNIVTNARDCFRVRNTSKRLNLYVHANSLTLSTCLNTNAATSLTGTNITWTADTANNRHYNTDQNIYIYPVANVKQAYKENELLLAKYTMNSGANVIPEVDSTTMITMEDRTHYDGTTTRSVYLDESQAGKLPSSISFNGATNLLTVEKLKIDNITDTSYMFNGCSNLTSICAMDWDTSKITKADYMFAGCSKLTKESFTSETIIKEHVLEYAEEGGSDSIDIGSIDNFVSIKYAIHEFTLDSFDTYDNGYSKRIGSDSTFTISNDGMCELYDGNEPQYECSVTVVYRYHEQIEFPNVESASHIFDGCTNLL